MVRRCRESGARMNACECASRASRTPTGHLHLLPCCEPCGSNAVATSSLARSPACLWSADFNILTQGNFNDLLNHPDTYSTHLCVCIIQYRTQCGGFFSFCLGLYWTLWLQCIKYICKSYCCVTGVETLHVWTIIRINSWHWGYGKNEMLTLTEKGRRTMTFRLKWKAKWGLGAVVSFLSSRFLIFHLL